MSGPQSSRSPIITDIRLAAQALREGRLVAFPTETVYGLGADALNEYAVAGVFAAKERPEFDPLIVHLADTIFLKQVVSDIPPVAQALCRQFWPGPLTLVLPKQEKIPDLVTSGAPTVAVRVPDHPMARQLLLEAGIPIAAPSANRFGQLSPTTARHVAEQLDGRIDWILEGGPCRVGVESTVVRPVDDTVEVLRFGGITIEALEACLGRPVRIAPPVIDEQTPAVSPGTLASHYAPTVPLALLSPADSIRPPEGPIGWLAFRVKPDLSRPGDFVEILSPEGDLQTAAANFFAALRRLDAAGVFLIIAEPVPEEGLGRALNDRLRRAAAPRST